MITGRYSMALAALICATGAMHGAAEAQTATGTSFVDRFSSLDAGRWMVSHGWSNGGHQGCTWSARNVQAGDGRITLSLTDEPFDQRQFSCAEVRTKAGYGFGTYEVRMRVAAGSGVTSTFFTYVGPPFGAGLPHDEIDFEFLGKNTTGVQLNYYGRNKGHHESIAKLGFDASQTSNDYAFYWGPDVIRWYVNGKLVRETKREGDEWPTTPGRIFISLWAGQGANMDGWLGRFTYPGQPMTATYELVAFTEDGKPCQFPTSIVCTLEKASQTGK
jgi:endo-1,3-1,4-beta-glycanase ExoK